MPSSSVESFEEAAAIFRMASAFVASQALYVAADLGIADHLAHGSLRSDDLACKLEVHPEALARLLQVLVAFGILKREGEQFSLTRTGELLRSDSPRSLRSTVRFIVGPWAWRAFEHLGYSVRTGQPSFDHVWGMSNFEYWERNPDVSTIHDEAMTGLTATETDRLLDAYDFSPFRTLVDVGGGNGALLAAILRQQPAATAVLTDLPHVVELASSLLEEQGVAERCEVVGGSFFEKIPSGGDLYILKHIIHNWDDKRSCAILRNCSRAMGSGFPLLIIDRVLPDEPIASDSTGYLVDMRMLALTPGGRERTESQFRALLASAGFDLEKVISVGGISDIIQARKSPAGLRASRVLQ